MFFRRKMFKKRNKAAIRVIKIIIALFTCLCLFFHYDNSITDIIVGIAIKNAEDTISESLSKSVASVIENSGITYSDLINTTYVDGKITALNANSINVNIIKSEIIIAVENELNKYNCLETVVQLGSLSGLNVLSNRGPDIHILYDLYCSSTATIQSSFSSAGLNQTCHKIMVQIKTEYCLVLNDGDHISSVNNDFIVAETVIVGDVPTTYGSIYGLNSKDG